MSCSFSWGRLRRASGPTGSLTPYDAFWKTHLMVSVGDLQLDLTLHALVNDGLMAIFVVTVELEVRREIAIGQLTSWFHALVPVAAAIAGLAASGTAFNTVSNRSSPAYAGQYRLCGPIPTSR
ncbi:Na+/H+ antiporter NhaA [Micromonospora coriariae]|uniref:Na+/H+ antiporter NhaA n=1 Tax=Micromonospora coriariae TaxID=285665 RepID=UPI0022B26378|nr:Na+/H+ antiporter NhaA [Micromonospora coriariae]